MIHPTAIIDPRAQLDVGVEVGPYAVIDAGVVVGPRCKIGPFVHLTCKTTIGADNTFHTGAVIGTPPQDFKYTGSLSRTRIGDRNAFREHVTVNRATDETQDTIIGSDNLFMAGSHVGHNARVGNRCVLANAALLAGHVEVHDCAVISGSCLVHQFVRVGTFAMMQGGAGISKDLPPYTMAQGVNAICGLNSVGLRRAGVCSEDRLELKRLYRFLFRGSLGLLRAVDEARRTFRRFPSIRLLDFIELSKRGVPTDVGRARRRVGALRLGDGVPDPA